MIDVSAIRTALDTPQEETRVNRMWQNIEKGNHAKSGLNREMRLVWISIAAVLTLSFFTYLLWESNDPLTLENGSSLPATITAQTSEKMNLSDGSYLLLQNEAVLDLLDNAEHIIRFYQRKGTVNFNVVPGGPKKWQVDCGSVSVEVVGTSFTIARHPNKVEISVHRGAVLVKGKNVENRIQRLEKGESLIIREMNRTKPQDSIPIEPTHNALKEPELKQSEVVVLSDSRPKNRNPKIVSKDVWREYAQKGDYKEAYTELGAEQLKTLSKKSQNAQELFLLADVARLGGNPKDAVLPLKTIVNKYSSDSKAGLAAYTLARIYLEQLAKPGEAAQLFGQAIGLGIPNALIETAMAKTVEAYAQLDSSHTYAAGKAYLTQYPNGRYRKRVETLITRAHNL